MGQMNSVSVMPLFITFPLEFFLPIGKKYGNAAGPIRNKQMAEYADALVAVWDGKSRGTKNMIDTAISMGLDVKVLNY